MEEHGTTLDRMDDLYERLFTAGRDEAAELRRELREAWKVQHKETADLVRVAKQVVVRRAEIRAGLLHHIAELEDLGERLPDDAAAEIRRRCEKLRGLVQEWR